MIQISNISKSFQGKKILNNINLKINKGDMIGLIGPNGAGKTTFLRILTGLLKPNEGEVLINNLNIIENRNKILKNIGFLPENNTLYRNLTGYENLNFFAKLYGFDRPSRSRRIKELLKLFNLQKITTNVKNYSNGMKQKLAIARALINHPKILFLDEPFNNLDHQSANKLQEYLTRINVENDITIIITTHYLLKAEKLCNRIIFINKGKIDFFGNMKELRFASNKTYQVKIILNNNKSIKIRKILQGINGIEKFHLNTDMISIYTTHPEEVNQKVIEKLVLEKIQIQEIITLKSDLETLYLNHYSL